MTDEELIAWVEANMPKSFTIAGVKAKMIQQGIEPPRAMMHVLDANGYSNSTGRWTHYTNVRLI